MNEITTKKDVNEILADSKSLTQYLEDVYEVEKNLYSVYQAKQIMEQEGITEELKSRDQMEWVRRANNARSRVDEIILNELVYV